MKEIARYLKGVHIKIGDQIDNPNGAGDKGDMLKFWSGPGNDS